MPTSLIIGAGMSGLSAARELARTGWTVTVIDKGRGVGGRMATRRLEQARADHGAQYFSAKTPAFQAYVQELLAEDVVNEWRLPDADHPRYIGRDGMSTVAKQLARDLDVRTGERAVNIEKTEAGCLVLTETGGRYEADSLLVTIPVPQALTLFNDSGLMLSDSEQAVLATIVYKPCLAVIVALNKPSRIPSPGILRFDEGPVSWVADNQQKGISPNQPSVTIHASHAFSQDHLEDDLNAVGRELIDQLPEFLPADAVATYQVHRWRYSQADQRHDESFLQINAPFPLLIGGDGFGMGNVEGAFQSGYEMAHWLMQKV
ncbi:hypothetical protein BN8_01240 [Fibrisoma limi BUZ 3]|uniref:Amine oxidase domain-containing protein n=1 Tax=Fibrisoma limi BUZ 3 TaxID=1185876 RepID=I2GEC9_9BACT|nr:FAD-dependent oxidoreductase [Fibrisoma limi]CCH52254.1 hypothetical protein BN8_01240 [Fibrisoma limi BUZ 3]